MILLNPYRFPTSGGGGDPGSPYLVSEDVDGSGTPAGWTNAGSPNWDYTTSPIVGAQSLLCSSELNTTTISFTPASTVWVFCRIRREATGGSSSTIPIVGLRSASDVNLALVTNRNNPAYRLLGGSIIGGFNATVSNGVNHALWLQYIIGTGANSIARMWLQEDGTEIRPASMYANHTTGNATADAAKLILGGASAAGMVFDKIRVSTSEIGDNPT